MEVESPTLFALYVILLHWMTTLGYLLACDDEFIAVSEAHALHKTGTAPVQSCLIVTSHCARHLGCLHPCIHFCCSCFRAVMDSPRAAEAIRILQGFGHEDAERLIQLEQRRKTLHQQRQAVQKEIKNESRKRQRLLEKARGLSDDSLLQVIVNRASKAQAKASGKAKAKAGATSAAATGVITIMATCWRKR